jgi:hypothetical protein
MVYSRETLIAELARRAVDVRCLDCKEETIFRADKADEDYMVHNALWLQANPAKDGMLCIGCLESRLGRRLEPSDFTGARVNGLDGRRESQRLKSRLTRC